MRENTQHRTSRSHTHLVLVLVLVPGGGCSSGFTGLCWIRLLPQKRKERRQDQTRRLRWVIFSSKLNVEAVSDGGAFIQRRPALSVEIKNKNTDFGRKQRRRRPSVLNAASRCLTVRRLRDNWGENWAFKAGDRKWNALKVKAWAAIGGWGGG